MLNQDTVFHQKLCSNTGELTVDIDLSQLRVTVLDRPEQVVEEWEFLGRYASDPFSNYVWVKAWYDAHKHDAKYSPVIILGADQANKPLFLLPLFRQKIGPFSVLLRPGRTHSAYFNGLFSPQCRQMVSTDNAGQFWKLVFAAVSGVDAIAIDGVREIENTYQNPLRFLPLMRSGNLSYASQLSPDWASFYKSKMSRKARSNVRRCEKRLSEQGELHFKTGNGKDDCLELLRALMAQKAAQFEVRGIHNPYKLDNISAFYENLVQSEENIETQSLVINAVFLDDQPLAVNLGMTQGKEFHGLIMSMVEGVLTRFSPGRILLLHTMQRLSEAGIRRFDFGVGQADYKDGWIDDSISRHHVLAPLGIKGRVFVLGIRIISTIKAILKGSSRAKELTKRARWYSQKD